MNLLLEFRRAWTVIARFLIGLFCIYHMMSVFLYALPSGLPQWAYTTKKYFDPIIRPYILSTSQWQIWNLFSPDPLRQVTEYSIELEEGNTWVEKRRITGQTIPWYERAHELKLLRRIHENDTRNELRKTYLESLCHSLEGGHQRIRMTRMFAVIPKDTLPVGSKMWSHRSLYFVPDSISIGYCP